jgi:plasmid stability protein
MRAAFKGRVVSAETRAKISAALKGRPTGRKGVPLTAEAKKKMSEAGKLRGAPKHPPEVIEKIAAAHRGRKRTLETCAKIAAAALGRPSSTKGKPSPLKGRTLSEAVKTKMSEAAKLRWSLQREKEYLT